MGVMREQKDALTVCLVKVSRQLGGLGGRCTCGFCATGNGSSSATIFRGPLRSGGLLVPISEYCFEADLAMGWIFSVIWTLVFWIPAKV